MNKRFHKRALSVTTAVLTLTTAVTTVNAAQRNEITIESSKSAVSSGETFNIAVGYEPDSVGASGFTIDLHYDTDAVNLNVDSDGGYTVVNGFAIVSNSDEEGVVRLVGANLSGANVTATTELANLSFTVKDGYHGDISFWTDVITLVAADGNDFVNVEFRAHGPYQQYTVSGPAEESSSAEETSAATEAVTSATEPEITETETETTTTTVTEPLPEEIIPETTTAETESPAESDEPEEEPAEPDESDEPDAEENDGEIFSYTQGGSDYNNEEALQYSFSPYDYVESADEPVDIEVSVSSTGSVQGGIGMQTSDGWKIYSAGFDGAGEEVWTAENVDLSDVSGDIAVQLYYLKNSSTFKISSISVTPSQSGEADEAPESDPDVTEAPSETAPAVTTAPAEEAPDEQQTAAVTNAPQADPETETSDSESSADETYSTAVTDEDTEGLAAESTESTDGKVDAAYTESGDESQADVTTTTTTTTSAADVQQAVSEASGKADSNPDTGSGVGKYVCAAVMVLCAAQMAYSIYALTRKNED